tara:strand:- start:97122 stop:100397 length:3276 start_codon:yes stop_codon:yes gene_type:complete
MENTTPPKRKGRRILRRVASLFATFCLFLIVFPIILALVIYSQNDDRVLSIPKLKDFVADKLDKNTPDFQFELGNAGLSKGGSILNPKLVFEEVVLRDQNDVPLIRMPRVGADLNILTGLGDKKGVLNIDSAQFLLLRDTDGRFNVGAADTSGTAKISQSFDETIDNLFELPIMQNIESLSVSNILLTYVDLKENQTFQLKNGVINVVNEDNELKISSNLELEREGQEPSLILFSGRRTKGGSTSDITFKIENADPVNLADQLPGLDWLRNIEAEASASFVVELGTDARLEQMNGVLDLGAGRLRETPANAGAMFESVKAYFDYDAATDFLSFSSFEMITSLGSVIGNSTAKMERDLAGRVIGAELEMGVDTILLNQPQMFDQPLKFGRGKVQADVQFSPIAVSVKKAVLNYGDLSIIASGDLWARPDFWQSKFDLRLDQLTAQQMKSLWPISFIPKTRKWIAKNLEKGVVSDFNGFFSRQDGQTEFDFKFAFDDVKTGLVPTVDPLQFGRGDGRLDQNKLTLNLADGQLIPTGGKALNMAGSVFHIADINARPAIGKVALKATGDLQSALMVLDAPKFQFIEKFGKTVDVANGNATVEGWLEVPLIKGAKPDAIKFDLAGVLDGVTSTKLIKGRALSADTINVSAKDSEISLSGEVNLDDVPTRFKWNQLLKNNPSKQSTVSGQLTLNKQSLDAFNISLPNGSFSGATPARVEIVMRPKTDGTFVLKSDLMGADLKIAPLGWSKPKNTKGSLSVSGVLSEPIKIDAIDVTANGLTAHGTVNFAPDGGFASAEFPSLTVGQWLSTSLMLTGVGSTATTNLSGGTVDLRQLDFGQSSGETAGPLILSLDRLRLTDDLSLTSFNANITRTGAPTGKFNARVNGGAAIRGTISRGTKGARITVTGNDAGNILRSAGFFDNIFGGATTIVLEPSEGSDVYEGRFDVSNFRMQHSNSMAALLDGISLVGLLQKLKGGGIQFGQAKGWFTLRPEGVQLREVSLVGASIGISLQGWFASKSKAVDFDGVVTPLYVVNGAFERIAGKLFGRQKGEGVFSFVYTMKGPAADPTVRVKPLSILTPGVFRQIFRQDIPAPPK